MYKLVAVAGKLRGSEYTLSEGENICGRDDSCDVPLTVNGISKKHMSVTVSGDAAYVKDLGSSNGTFLNGKIIKQATVKKGDKIALPDLILQVVYVKEKKILVKKKAEGEGEDVEDEEDFTKVPPPPKDLQKKIFWMFQHKIMPILHGINEEYEWRSMMGMLLGVFIFITIFLVIFPVLSESKRILLIETAKRGEHFADEIARLNARALEQKNLDRVDSTFLDNEEDVKSYELFDLEGRIVRPMGKLNEYISDPLSIKARDWAKNTALKASSAQKEILNDGEIGIAQKIMAYNARTGMSEAVGVIAIRFTPKTLSYKATKDSKAFLEALVTSALVALVYFGFIYYLTLKPIEEIKWQAEEALRGKRKNVEPKLMFAELGSLKNTINTLLSRVRELSNEGGDGDFDELEDPVPYANHLAEFMTGSNGPAMVLDHEKNLFRINPMAEDITGIRETGSEGMSLLDIAREQGFAATVIELCDNAANNGGMNQNASYELSGHEYNVHVVSMMGKDNFAKAFYITFVLDE